MTFQPHFPLIIDSFAGGGGASTGIEMALGRSPDVAINHSEKALALHAANHPETLHLDSNIWDVDPLSVTKGRHVGLLWASPDCKHFSKAKGGAPRDRNIRDLAWVVVKWAEFAKPDVICMENVEEFVTWGPVDDDGQPIKQLAGVTFDLWLKRLKKAGYRVQWRELRACDYGTPTIRKRWFLIARRDGRPIVWPKPTHGDPKSKEVRKGKLLPWVGAHTCIDWSLPCPSIFDTSAEIMAKHGLRAVRPLAKNTMARVARGMGRYVIESLDPFLVSLKGTDRRDRPVNAPHPTVLAGGGHSSLVVPSIVGCGGRAGQSRPRGGDEPFATITAGGAGLTLVASVLTYAQQGGGNRSVEDPHHTICASRKDQNGLIAATMVQTGYGERQGQAPRALDIEAPLGTVVAGGAKHAPIAAFLAQHNNDSRRIGGVNPGRRADDPMATVTATGGHQMPVAAFFAKYYGTGDGARTDEPLHTVTVKDRMAHLQAELAAPPFAPEHEARARQVAEFLRDHGVWDGGEFVTLEIDGTTYVVIDIGMRMLTPRELFRAQGFPEDYVIEGVWRKDEAGEWHWQPFAKDVQVSCRGNSVCPPIAAAIVGANCQHIAIEAERRMA
ncbi:DNA cytosine methyltransferase [Paracoccus sp. (in: a-proteobacteria)]|uniref:DNA cytosine methyltransferase n=1 Tax=Paracoccus sp. TaxID=267 RepID=UPI002AFE8DF4|nr:DNA cytosine methyltransferase [Paracoccus sp. (in: a-proteobacteria)]